MSKQTAEDIKEAKRLAILAAEVLYNYRLIGRSVGRDEDTLLRWREEDPEFAEALQKGRTAFIEKQMGRAKPEFLLERMEREVFAPPTQLLEHSGGINPIRVLLDAYGVTEGQQDGTKTDEPVQDSSASQA